MSLVVHLKRLPYLTLLKYRKKDPFYHYFIFLTFSRDLAVGVYFLNWQELINSANFTQ